MKRSRFALAPFLAVALTLVFATGVYSSAPRTVPQPDEFAVSPTDGEGAASQYSCESEEYCRWVARFDCVVRGGRANEGHAYWSPGVCMWVCADGHNHVQVCQSF